MRRRGEESRTDWVENEDCGERVVDRLHVDSMGVEGSLDVIVERVA